MPPACSTAPTTTPGSTSSNSAAEVSRRTRFAARASGRIETFGFIGGGRGRRRDELHERLGGLVVLGLGVERRREHGYDLKLAGKRSDHFHARHRREFGNLLYPDLGLARGEQFSDRAGRVLVLGLNLGRDAEPLDHLLEIHA